MVNERMASKIPTKFARKKHHSMNKPEPEIASKQPEQSGVPVLAADVNGKLLGEAGLIALNEHIKQNYKPEQPKEKRWKQ